MIRGKVGPRPAAPKAIPDWAIWFPSWVKWRMNGKVGPRPKGVPVSIPLWAWEPHAETIRVLRTPPPQDAAKEQSLTLWRGMGVWATSLPDLPVFHLELYAAGQYDYVVVPTLFGTRSDVRIEGLDAYVAQARAAGFKVVGSQWGAATTVAEAEAEAEVGAASYKAHGFDGWCINGEKVYEGGGRSGAYARRFRARAGFAPLLWSPEPRLALDHDVLQELGVAYGPQAYPLENGWDVSMAAEWGCIMFGYEAKNVVPLVQAYPASDGRRYPAALYRDQARSHGLPGVILYTGNQALDVPSYWRELVL